MRFLSRPSVPHQRPASALHDRCEPHLNRPAVDVLGVERAVVPAEHLPVLGMVAVEHSIEELVKAGLAADILRRSTAGAVDLDGLYH